MPFYMFNHPFLFAAVAVVAIGVVVYELIEENKRRQPTNGRRPPSPPRPPPSLPPPSNRPRPPPGPPPPSNRPRPPPGSPPPSKLLEPPPDDSQKLPDSPTFAPSNNLRKRNINQTSSKESTAEKFKESEKSIKISPTCSQNSPDKKFDENNYCQNMLDKLTNDTKSVNENIKGEIFGHNIYEEESDSSENNLLPKGEEKVINQAKKNENVCNSKKPYKRKRKTKYNVEKSAKTHIDKKHDNSDYYETGSISDSQSDNSAIFSSVKVTKVSPIKQKHASKNTCDQSSKSHSSNLYPKLDLHPLSDSGSELVESNLSSDENEDLYKKDMLKAFKNDLQNCEITYNTDTSVACSSENIEKEILSESKLCKGCEENQVNTHAYPCNHAYLCVDCALKVFRLYKKCTICLQDIEEFVQFAL